MNFSPRTVVVSDCLWFIDNKIICAAHPPNFVPIVSNQSVIKILHGAKEWGPTLSDFYRVAVAESQLIPHEESWSECKDEIKVAIRTRHGLHNQFIVELRMARVELISRLDLTSVIWLQTQQEDLHYIWVT